MKINYEKTRKVLCKNTTILIYTSLVKVYVMVKWPWPFALSRARVTEALFTFLVEGIFAWLLIYVVISGTQILYVQFLFMLSSDKEEKQMHHTCDSNCWIESSRIKWGWIEVFQHERDDICWYLFLSKWLRETKEEEMEFGWSTCWLKLLKQKS